jgi:hypothetical protein
MLQDRSSSSINTVDTHELDTSQAVWSRQAVIGLSSSSASSSLSSSPRVGLESVINKGNSDPFDSIVLPLSALNAHCIRLAREFQVGNIWSDKLIPDELQQTTLNWWLSDVTSISFETTMHGLLAWAYTSRLSVQAYPPQQIRLKALEHQTLGLSGLRALVSNLTTSAHRLAAFECMLFLAAVEWTAGNVDALMAHMRSAAAMLRSMGGLYALPELKMQSSLWMFVNLCFYFPMRPLIRPGDFDPGPLTAQADLFRSLASSVGWSSKMIPHRRVDGTVLSALAGGPTLVSIWEALTEILTVMELAQSNHKALVRLASRLNQWYFLRKHATRLRLEHLWHDLKVQHEKVEYIAYTGPDGIFASAHHAFLWHICMCMASRIFDELAFSEAHPNSDHSEHWNPFFTRYQTHLWSLEAQEVEVHRQETASRTPETQRWCHAALQWLYFMGSCVEILACRAQPLSTSDHDSTTKAKRCTPALMELSRSLGTEDHKKIADTFKENFLFSESVMGIVLTRLFSADHNISLKR